MTKKVGEFCLFGLPKTINEIGRKHWSFKYKEANLWKGLVYHACVLNKIASLELEQASMELTRHSSREPDFDNLAGSFKHVIDGLVEAGVIVDDKPSVIGSPVFKWEKTKIKGGFITVKVFTEVEIIIRA